MKSMKSRREMTRQTVMMKNSVVIIDSAPWPAFRNAAALLPEPDNTSITIIISEAQCLNDPIGKKHLLSFENDNLQFKIGVNIIPTEAPSTVPKTGSHFNGSVS